MQTRNSLLHYSHFKSRNKLYLTKTFPLIYSLTGNVIKFSHSNTLLHYQWTENPIRTNGHQSHPKLTFAMLDLETHLIHDSSDPNLLTIQNSSSITSAIFEWLMPHSPPMLHCTILFPPKICPFHSGNMDPSLLSIPNPPHQTACRPSLPFFQIYSLSLIHI